MSWIARVLVAAVLSMLLAVPIHADDIAAGGRLTWVDNQHIDDNSMMVGVMARLHSGFLGIEAGIDFRSDDLDGGAELKSRPLTAGLMLRPIPIVYAIAGLGLYRSEIKFPSGLPYSDQTDNSLGYFYGVGAELPIVPLLKITGDIRYHYVGYEFDDIPASIGEVDADAFTISTGLLLSF